MTSFTPGTFLAHPKVRATAALSVLALLGNMASVPLFFGVDIVFGSIPVLLAVALLGTRAAVVVAFVGALYTVFLWGHPWAIGEFVLEALVVGMLYRRGQRNLVLADLTFWVLAAGPIFFLFYRTLLGLDLVTTTIITLKTSLNGIFNALIAGLILLAINLLSRNRRRSGLAGAGMSNLLFHSLLTAILLTGATPIVYEGHAHRRQLESALGERLHEHAESLSRRLSRGMPMTPTQQRAELANTQVSPDMGLALVAQDGHVMASQGVVASIGSAGDKTALENAMSFWVPPGDMSKIQRRKQGRYAVSVPLDKDVAGPKLVIEDSAAPLVRELERHRLTLFYFLAIMTLIGILIARLLAGSLSRPLRALEAASRNLTQQIAEGEQPEFPHTAINEYGNLSRSLREMATRLSDSFNALQAHQAGLEAQVELRTSELNRFKSTLDRALDCVFMFDADTLQFFYVNEGAVKQVGYTRDELMTMHPYDFKPHMVEAKFREKIIPLVSGEEESLTFETIHRHKNGSTLPVEIFLQYVAPAGEQPRFVAFVRDITERKRVERMESEFVATVSHELRTPLTSITGSLGLIMGGALGELPKQATELISIAHKNSQRLTYLINDLLDMEKLVVGKLQFDMRPQSLHPLIQQSVDTHRPYGAPRNVTIELRSDIAETQVCVDGQRLMQVMSNLLSNAIKFSPDTGVVEVEVTRDDANVRVKVTDHGPGVPAEFRANIFEKFAQADASDTRLKGGTGLGLAITRELVSRMGGRIDFTSEEGQGACFYFELPQWRAQPKAPIVETPEWTPTTACSARVLIIEDEPDVARLLEHILTRAGYRASTVSTGKAAIDALCETPYDAVTLDLRLPDMHGREVIARLRERPATAALPILVISVIDRSIHDTTIGDAKYVEWLGKPIDAAQVLAALKTLLSGALRPPRRVLHVEDDTDMREIVSAMLGNAVDVCQAATLDDARQLIAAEDFDVVLLDIGLPDGCGWDLLPALRADHPKTRVVVLSIDDDCNRHGADVADGVLIKRHLTAHDLHLAIGLSTPVTLAEENA